MALCFKVLSVNDYIVLHCHYRGGREEGGREGGREEGREREGERERERERGCNATVTHSLKSVTRYCLNFKMMLCRSQCYLFRDYQYFHLTEQFARFVNQWRVGSSRTTTSVSFTPFCLVSLWRK